MTEAQGDIIISLLEAVEIMLRVLLWFAIFDVGMRIYVRMAGRYGGMIGGWGGGGKRK